MNRNSHFPKQPELSKRGTTAWAAFWIVLLSAPSFFAEAANWGIDVDLTDFGHGLYQESELVTEINQDGRPYYRLGDLHVLAAPSSRAGFSGNLWSNSRLYYQFSSGVPESRRQTFRTALEKFSQHTALDFVESSSAGNRVYIIDESDNPNYNACGSSFLGMIGGVQNMRIKCWTTRTIQHEIGHALGLIHEHQRSDRDTYIEVLWDTLTPCNSQSTIDVNFGIMSSQNTTAYDFESVMHYPYYAGCGGSRVFNARPGYEEFQFNMGSSSLTDTDLDGLAERYHRKLRVSDQNGSADGLAIRFVSGSRVRGCGTGCEVIANDAELELVVVGHGRRIPYKSNHPSCHRVSCTATMNDNVELDVEVFDWSPSNPELTLVGLQNNGRYPSALYPSAIFSAASSPELLVGSSIPVDLRTGGDPAAYWPQPNECPPEINAEFCLGFLDPYTGEISGLFGLPYSSSFQWLFGLLGNANKNAVITNEDIEPKDNNGERDLYLWDRSTGEFELASWNYSETGSAIEEEHAGLSVRAVSGDSRILLYVNEYVNDFLDIPELPPGRNIVGYHTAEKRAYLIPSLNWSWPELGPYIAGSPWHEEICVKADRRTYDGQIGSVIFTTHAEFFEEKFIAFTGKNQTLWNCQFISKSARWVGITGLMDGPSTYNFMLYDGVSDSLSYYPLGSGQLNELANRSYSVTMDPTERFILFRGRHDSYVSLPRGHDDLDLYLHDRFRNITTIINTANDGIPSTGTIFSSHTVNAPGFADNGNVVFWLDSKQLLQPEGVASGGAFVVENPFLAIDEIECGGPCSFDVLFRDNFSAQ